MMKENICFMTIRQLIHECMKTWLSLLQGMMPVIFEMTNKNKNMPVFACRMVFSARSIPDALHDLYDFRMIIHNAYVTINKGIGQYN